MESIEIKSFGMLLDELITTNIKCWHAQERLKALYISGDSDGAAVVGLQAQELNARRNKLIRAIDKRMGEGDISPTEKTYG